MNCLGCKACADFPPIFSEFFRQVRDIHDSGSLRFPVLDRIAARQRLRNALALECWEKMEGM